MIRELKDKGLKNLIKRIRTDYGLTQDELAEKIYVSRQLISNWEKNNTVPTKDTMDLICKELSISKKHYYLNMDMVEENYLDIA